MHQIIDRTAFIQAFTTMGRAHNFSRAALVALFEYLEEVSPELELDVIGLCCEFTEYGSAFEAAQDFDYAPDPEEEDVDTLEESALDWLRGKTCVLDTSGGGVIIANF